MNINAPEFLVILVIALVVIGPQRLPEYAENLGRWVRQLRDMALGARESVRVELGPEFDDVDWTKFDPRQYDPRRIVRDALMEPVAPRGASTAAAEPEPEPVDLVKAEPAPLVVDSQEAAGIVAQEEPEHTGAHPVLAPEAVVFDDEAT